MFPEDLLWNTIFHTRTLIIQIAYEVLLQSCTKYLLSFSVQDPGVGTRIQLCRKQIRLLTQGSLVARREHTEINK